MCCCGVAEMAGASPASKGTMSLHSIFSFSLNSTVTISSTSLLQPFTRSPPIRKMANKSALAKGHLTSVTGHPFGNEQLVTQALDTTGLRAPQANRRLALLGDMLLRAVIVDEWYPTGAATGMILFDDGGVQASCSRSTGVADRTLQSVAGNTNLARVGDACGLASHIITNPGHRGAISNKTLATTVEAILGAIFLDSGKDLEAVKEAMQSMGISED